MVRGLFGNLKQEYLYNRAHHTFDDIIKTVFKVAAINTGIGLLMFMHTTVEKSIEIRNIANNSNMLKNHTNIKLFAELYNSKYYVVSGKLYKNNKKFKNDNFSFHDEDLKSFGYRNIRINTNILGSDYLETLIYIGIPKDASADGIYYNAKDLLMFYLFVFFISSTVIIVLVIISKKDGIKKGGMLYANISNERELIMKERTLSYKANNINHELSSPLTAMSTRVRKLRRLTKRVLSSCSSTEEEEINALFLSIFTNIEQIDATLNNSTKYNNKKDALSNVGHYIQEAFDTISEERVSLQKATVRIAHLIREYDINNSTGLSNGSFINIIVNHIKNSLEANATEIVFTVSNIHKCKMTILIRDNGNGIPEDKVSSVFVYKESTKGTGRGVGMYINRSLLLDCGGDERLVSTSKRGTTFELTIPVNRIKLENGERSQISCTDCKSEECKFCVGHSEK